MQMNRDEMREAAEMIGLTYRGDQVDLLNVYPERGTARIVHRGTSSEVRVTELYWNTTPEGTQP